MTTSISVAGQVSGPVVGTAVVAARSEEAGADGPSVEKTSLSKPSVVSGNTSGGGSMMAQLIVIPAK
jgi:hypothetical protein